MPATQPLNIDIYARKSRLKDSSESVSTQVSLCREYIARNYPAASIRVYDEDEGFSGGNTDRPGYQRLMQDVRSGSVDVIVVYRLDRIGRDLRDFCNLLDELQSQGISFVSVRENFCGDGAFVRATMLISSLFSQLERDLDSERLTDSLYDRARMGHWLGGTTPTGYVTRRVSVQGKKRMHVYSALAPDPVPLAQVVHLFEQFVSLGSLSALLTYTLQQGIRARNGGEYHRKTLRDLLSNPVYCTADAAAWVYFSTHDYALNVNEEDFDGEHGLMPYARTKKMRGLTIARPTSEWIIATGAHPGAVPGALWVRAQEIFEENKDKGASWRGRRTENALLSGVIRCGSCGAAMRPKAYGKPLPDGRRRTAYVCSRKDASNRQLCQQKNAPAHIVDDLVVDHLRQLAQHYSAMSLDASALHQSQAQASAESLLRLRADLRTTQRKLDNLAETLEEGLPPSARQTVYKRMADLEASSEDLRQQIAALESSDIDEAAEQMLMHLVAETFSTFGDAWQQLTHDERRRLIRAVVDQVVWDGKNLDISVLGAKTLPG